MRPALTILVAALLLPTGAASEADFRKVSVQGDAPRGGLYDPSIEYGGDSSEGWLVYSAVSGQEEPYGPNVETHLAKTQDGGATFSFVRKINASSARTEVTLADGRKVRGQWNYEVPSLAYDGSDSEAPWKLFYHRIFREIRKDGTSKNVPAASWIGFRTTTDPTAGWSEEVALFQGSVPLPDGVAAKVNVSRLDAGLEDLLVYSEPGAFATASRLFVALTGLLRSGPDRIVLLVSDDHGQSWTFVSSVLLRKDAEALGYRSFDGASVVEHKGRAHLLVTPASRSHRHFGTLLFEFEDLAMGALARDPEGAPAVRAHFLPPEGFDNPIGGGQADYHESARAAGLLVNQLTLKSRPELFQIRTTDWKLRKTSAAGESGIER